MHIKEYTGTEQMQTEVRHFLEATKQLDLLKLNSTKRP